MIDYRVYVAKLLVVKHGADLCRSMYVVQTW